MNNEELVKRIIDLAGGKENIVSASNCMTRLRIQVRDDSAVQTAALKSTEGVLGVVFDRAHQPEIVLGPGKCKKCADLCLQMGIGGAAELAPKAENDWKSNKSAVRSRQKHSAVKTALKSFGDIFVPLIPGIIAAGFCAGLAMLLSQLVPSCKEGGAWGVVYQLLSLFNTAFMTYITAWAGYRAAEKFGATPILGGMLGMVTGLDGINEISRILHLWNEAEPLDSMLRTGRGGVLAVIIGVWCLAFVEKRLRKHMPESLDIVFTPLLSLLICSIPYILLIMPAMGYVSSSICFVMEKGCMSSSPLIRMAVGYIATALFLPLVAMGMHHGLIAIYSVQLASQGYVTLYPSLAMAGAGQVGAAIAIWIIAKRVKNDRLCSVIRGALPAGVFGIGEPLIYGVTLPMGKPFITAGLGAGFGGAFVMLFQVAATTWGPSGVLGFFVMTAGPNGALKTMLFYGIGLLIACVMGGLITYFCIRPSDVTEQAEPDEKPKPAAAVRVAHGETVLRFTDPDACVIRDPSGIHARPAGQIAALAKRFDAAVTLSANGKTARADSILEIMSLGAAKGTAVSLRAEGEQKAEALEAIRAFMKENL